MTNENELNESTRRLSQALLEMIHGKTKPLPGCTVDHADLASEEITFTSASHRSDGLTPEYLKNQD